MPHQKTITRQAPRNAKEIHKFLTFLTKQGFKRAPDALSLTTDKEELSYVPGTTREDHPLPERSLISAAKLLREYHDVSSKYLKTPDFHERGWFMEEVTPYEVMCHNDFAPYNVCFEGDVATGIIDFDTVSPGPRMWDIVHAAYRFCPLSHEVSMDTLIPRLQLFLDSYGSEDLNLGDFSDLLLKRLRMLHEYVETHKEAPKVRADYLASHHELYLRDYRYIQSRRVVFEEAIELYEKNNLIK